MRIGGSKELRCVPESGIGTTCDYAACPAGEHIEDTGRVTGGCKELMCVADQV
jgi:hypothetical protein